MGGEGGGGGGGKIKGLKGMDRLEGGFIRLIIDQNGVRRGGGYIC